MCVCWWRCYYWTHNTVKYVCMVNTRYICESKMKERANHKQFPKQTLWKRIVFVNSVWLRARLVYTIFNRLICPFICINRVCSLSASLQFVYVCVFSSFKLPVEIMYIQIPKPIHCCCCLFPPNARPFNATALKLVLALAHATNTGIIGKHKHDGWLSCKN